MGFYPADLAGFKKSERALGLEDTVNGKASAFWQSNESGVDLGKIDYQKPTA